MRRQPRFTCLPRYTLFALRLQNRGTDRLTLPRAVFGKFGCGFSLGLIGNLNLIPHRKSPAAFGQSRRHALMLNHVGLTLQSGHAVLHRDSKVIGEAYF